MLCLSKLLVKLRDFSNLLQNLWDYYDNDCKVSNIIPIEVYF